MKSSDPIRDPIVDEVRQVRLEIDRQYGSSFDSYTAHLRQIQEQYRSQLVSRDARPRDPGPGVSSE